MTTYTTKFAGKEFEDYSIEGILSAVCNDILDGCRLDSNRWHYDDYLMNDHENHAWAKAARVGEAYSLGEGDNEVIIEKTIERDGRGVTETERWVITAEFDEIEDEVDIDSAIMVDDAA